MFYIVNFFLALWPVHACPKPNFTVYFVVLIQYFILNQTLCISQTTKLGPGSYNIEKHGTFSSDAVAKAASGPGIFAYFILHYKQRGSLQ